MRQKYQTIEEPEVNSLKEDLLLQKSALEKRIQRLEDKGTREELESSLEKMRDISESLIPLQESLNIVWKRTQQVQEEIKTLIEKHS